MKDEQFLKQLGSTVRYYRQQRGWSQEELAHKAGYTTDNARSTISKIEGGASDISLSTLKILAKALGVSADTLMQGVQDPQRATDDRHFRVPVLGRVAAGIPIEMVQEIVDWEDLSKDIFREDPREYFGLKIKGHSMEPAICDSDVVIVHKQDDADDGDIVIAAVNGDDATCKRLKKYQTSLSLVPINPTYQPMVFTAQEVDALPITIIGKVVELRRSL